MITANIEQPIGFCYASRRMKWRNIPDMAMPMPEQVDPIEMAIYAAEMSPDTPRVDLHEMRVDEAIREADAFLNHEFAGRSRKEIKVVKIIHGRGKGVLAKAIADYLEEIIANPRPEKRIIQKYQTSKDPSQANAVTLVVLAPNKK